VGEAFSTISGDTILSHPLGNNYLAKPVMCHHRFSSLGSLRSHMKVRSILHSSDSTTSLTSLMISLYTRFPKVSGQRRKLLITPYRPETLTVKSTITTGICTHRAETNGLASRFIDSIWKLMSGCSCRLLKTLMRSTD
jgi:hypothetical protein